MEKFLKYFERLKRANKAITDTNHRRLYLVSIDSLNILASTKFQVNDQTSLGGGSTCKLFVEALKMLALYSPGKELVARNDFLLRIFRELGYFCFSAHEKGQILVSVPKADTFEFEEKASEIVKLIQLQLHSLLSVKEEKNEEFFKALAERTAIAEDFFISQKGEWISSFVENLGDEISKSSFITYLFQRIQAKVFDNADICYPVAPPMVTAKWRQERENLKLELPILLDENNQKVNERHYHCVFVLDQYSIKGEVEALPGERVADVGAFIGDTAYYFSRKVGNLGKVFAFEISSKSNELGQRNMLLNNCKNVQFYRYAVFDKVGFLKLSISEDASMNSVTENSEIDNTVEVPTITIDDFCKRYNEKIDFIKADIEGSELAMLRGASQIIKETAPKCAICLYHKRDDFWKIPDYLKFLRPDYKFYFRCEAEPVLFAKLK